MFLARNSEMNTVVSSNFWFGAIVGLILCGSNCFVILKIFRSFMII